MNRTKLINEIIHTSKQLDAFLTHITGLVFKKNETIPESQIMEVRRFANDPEYAHRTLESFSDHDLKKGLDNAKEILYKAQVTLEVIRELRKKDSGQAKKLH